MLFILHLFRLFVNQRRSRRWDHLCKEFVVETKCKDEHHDERQHISQVAAHPVLHLETLAGVDLFL